MPQTTTADHRRSSEHELRAALRSRDALALAEAYHRTSPAAHAVARRLLSASADVEALLRTVYAELWQAAPDEPLERWVRTRTFALAAAELAERQAAPASPSTATLLPDLPAPEVRFLDAAERALGELDDEDRRVLLEAHDRGVPASTQEDHDGPARLRRALVALAGPETAAVAPGADDDTCHDATELADWVLGLVADDTAEAMVDVGAQRPGCAALTRTLRRGRRRLEGLPATPDMGQRILVLVLTGAPGAQPAAGAAAATPLASALDAPGELESTGPMAPLPRRTPPSPGGATADERALWGPVEGPAGTSRETADGAVSGVEEHAAPSRQTDPDTPDGEDPYRSLADADDDGDADEIAAVATDDADDTGEGDEVVWDYDDLEEGESAGRKALRWLGIGLLVAAGSVVGLYLGNLFVS